jgi:hypothetical protein
MLQGLGLAYRLVRGASKLAKSIRGGKKAAPKKPDYFVDSKGTARKGRPTKATAPANKKQDVISVDGTGVARKANYPVATQGNRSPAVVKGSNRGAKQSGVNARSVAGAVVSGASAVLGMRDLEETPYDPSKVIPSLWKSKPDNSAALARSARASAAVTDPRRVDNGARRTQGNAGGTAAKKIVQTATQSASQKPTVKSRSVSSNPVAAVDVTPSAAARADDRPQRTVFQTEGTKVATASPVQDAAPDEASIMKKYGVSNLKQLGLAVSNAERKANPSGGAFASFQRFTEGNIDQAGSAAYSKYGAGYGKSVVDREIAAFKKKKGAKK